RAVIGLAAQHLDQLGQKLRVGLVALALEWVEAGRCAVFQCQIKAPKARWPWQIPRPSVVS
ncbi:hypothetical protein, partial [Xanthomonas fragariae]|uniref:hypothetical protein n=1 Tax=Xanthomonas fragariae TaxID=48664 RepID=UPI002B205A7D